jgi:hypothetical protein
MRSGVLRPLLSAGVALAWMLALPERAHAHQQGQSYCTVHMVPGGIDVAVETPAEHLVEVLGLSSLEPSDAELLEARERLRRALEDSVIAHTEAGRCQVTSEEPRIVRREGRRSLEGVLHYECPHGPVTLQNGWRFDVDPASEVVCAIDGSAWVFRRGSQEFAVGTPPSLLAVLVSFVKSGALHVVTGLDHVLFVIALLVAAAWTARKDSWLAGLRSMALVVTGFTLGHSLTLIAAGLELVRVEPRLTESVIALSIVLVGVENVLREEVRFRALTAAAFGLVHGFGFASVLARTELPRRGAIGALLSFNLGIELAQLAIVLACFPVLALLARRTGYRTRLLVPVSAGIALLGALWFVKRAAGLEFLPWLGS